jgi:PleD family two-component response regulator
MNSKESLATEYQRPPGEDPNQTEFFRKDEREHLHADAPLPTTRMERADSRTEQAEERTIQAIIRTEQAEARTELANTRTEQAEARTEQANTRTEQAEMRTKQAEARNAGETEKPAMAPGKKRILAVDDQASNTRLVKLYLEGTNHYLVREENNPKAALSAAEEFQPDLILLDVMMPNLDGGTLAACFQANPKLKSVPIIFLTAVVTQGDVPPTGGWVGGQFFLPKPIVLTDMVACLKQQFGEC